MMNDQYLKHDPHPVYLGVTLGRTLSYKLHLTKVAMTTYSRNWQAPAGVQMQTPYGLWH